VNARTLGGGRCCARRTRCRIDDRRHSARSEPTRGGSMHLARRVAGSQCVLRAPPRPAPDSPGTGTFGPPRIWDVRRRTGASPHGPTRRVLRRVPVSLLAVRHRPPSVRSPSGDGHRVASTREPMDRKDGRGGPNEATSARRSTRCCLVGGAPVDRVGAGRTVRLTRRRCRFGHDRRCLAGVRLGPDGRGRRPDGEGLRRERRPLRWDGNVHPREVLLRPEQPQ
jgi:hypothetical protein